VLVSPVELLRVQIPTAMLESETLITTLRAGMISSKPGYVLFVIWVTLHYTSNLIVSELLWMLAPSMLCGGISQDLRVCGALIPTAEFLRQASHSSYILFVIRLFAIHHNMGLAEYGNTYWQKHKFQYEINSLWEVPELTGSTVDETALAILKPHGSWGISIVSLQWIFIFNISVVFILTNLTRNNV